jgi:hypothetical protein
VTTVALLRTGFLNQRLRRVDGDAVPWSDAQCNALLVDALSQLWNDEIGKFVTGTVATDQASDVYSLPATFLGAGGVGISSKVSRIELEHTSGGVSRRADRVTNWRPYSDTQVRINPMLPTDSSLLLRFFGWAPFAIDASDLPVRLENVVAMKAAALAYGELSSHLANSQTQQGLDSGRVVDYPTAVGLSAYWERRYQDQVERDPARRNFAPRSAHR